MPDSEAVQERRIQRERVLSLLYEAEMKSTSIEEVIGALPVPPDDFVRETVLSVGAHQDQLDALITKYLVGWDFDRIASINRSILRIGAYELSERPSLSTALINNEAVELAKRFDSEDAAGFVNAVLDSIAKEVRAA